MALVWTAAVFSSGVLPVFATGGQTTQRFSASSLDVLDETVFVMEEGASVRLKKGQSGLRYTALMDKADYETLLAYGKELTFGMLICPYDYLERYGELSPETVFGENAVYTTDEGEGVRIICVSAPYLVEYDETRVCFNGAIINILAGNIGREFYGIGYIALTDEAGTHYKFALENDNRRSVTYVAQRAMESGRDYDEEKLSILSEYVNNSVQQTVPYSVNHYLEQNGTFILEKSETFTAALGETVYAEEEVFEGYALHQKISTLTSIAYANGKTSLDLYYVNEGEIGNVAYDVDLSASENVLKTERLYGSVLSVNGIAVTESDGEIVLNAEQTSRILAAASGDEWTFETEYREYQIPVRIFNKIIRTFKELSVLNEIPYGNYLLGGNICGNGGPFRVTEEFSGTFDGNGYAVCDVNVGKGFFKMLGMTGTVKNLRLKDVSATSAALAYETEGVIENVVVESRDAKSVVQKAGSAAKISRVFAILPQGTCFVQETAEGEPPLMSNFIGLVVSYTTGSVADINIAEKFPCVTVADVCAAVAAYGWDGLVYANDTLRFFGAYVMVL